ncbi:MULTISPECIES: hypothetical protein [unclassified Rhizobium]|uniref:hypothetical protein n=1 Tax=unclassified Rhizobium TaxID=2613769 RepID=UPI0011C3A977|nr:MULTISPECIES: hypothetical protein [unclassified Rhizobium]MBN8951425.1 hypothetical protein [Rhizobium tropici]
MRAWQWQVAPDNRAALVSKAARSNAMVIVVISGIATEKATALTTSENGKARFVEASCPAKQRPRPVRGQKSVEEQTRSQSHQPMCAPEKHKHMHQADKIPQPRHARSEASLRRGLAVLSLAWPAQLVPIKNFQEATELFVVSRHIHPSRSQTGRASPDRQNYDLPDLMR